MILMKVNYAVENVMNIEKPIVKNIKIDTMRNKEKYIKKIKSIDLGNRNRENYLITKLLVVLFVISQ